MPTIVKGQPTSEEVRRALRDEGRPVLVAYSTGKDAIATTLALKDAGIDVQLAYMYLVPGLEFVERTLSQHEELLGQRIHRYPHPSLWRWLNSYVWQPPERLSVIFGAQMPTYDYDFLWEQIRRHLGLDHDTWVADGVRAADSIVRRASLTKHGVMKQTNRKVSPIHDWLKRDVVECLERHKFPLPVDYEWFGRSFDGIDYRFLAPMREHAPDDYQRVLEWFPLAEMEVLRVEHYGLKRK